MKSAVKIIECPRDAMQGLHDFIPAERKAAYINKILKAGFDTVDFGSFVSPKAIPQMRDTAQVLSMLDLSSSSSRLLAIVANTRGAQDAVEFEEITFLGFPFSVSETFQKRNTNATIAGSLQTVEEIQDLCLRNNKQLVVYLSMGFGNPYGDPWSPEMVAGWMEKVISLGIQTISLADTVGVSTPESISMLFTYLTGCFPVIETGVHLHSRPEQSREKIKAAYQSGCRRFDGTIRGFGGCPMAKDDLVGNIDTGILLDYFHSIPVHTGVNMSLFREAEAEATGLFPVRMPAGKNNE